MRVVICGATSHIARAIAPFFSEHELILFARDPQGLQGENVSVESDFSRLAATPCDVLINCIGAGTPNIVKSDPSLWFTVLEKFDTLALDALRKCSPDALYVHFSSGAVYDRDSNVPASDESSRTVFPNNIEIKDYYSIAKLYAEAKHRSMKSLRIIDLRIFSFFSSHIKLDSGYFMTDLVSALLDKKEFITKRNDIVRDFPAPADLAQIIIRASGMEINDSFDVYSAREVKKSEIIEEFSSQFGLKVRYEECQNTSPNGDSDIYFSKSQKLQRELGFTPQYTSIETLVDETRKILQKQEI